MVFSPLWSRGSVQNHRDPSRRRFSWSRHRCRVDPAQSIDFPCLPSRDLPSLLSKVGPERRSQLAGIEHAIIEKIKKIEQGSRTPCAPFIPIDSIAENSRADVSEESANIKSIDRATTTTAVGWEGASSGRRLRLMQQETRQWPHKCSSPARWQHRATGRSRSRSLGLA